jgi:hypothetical protein
LMSEVKVETAGDSKTVSYTVTEPVSTIAVLDGSAFEPVSGLVNPTHRQDYTNKTGKYGGFYNMPRPFFEKTRTLAWSYEAVACLKDEEIPVISKKIPDNLVAFRAELTAFVNSCPALPRFKKVLFCLHHEPRMSGDVSNVNYRLAYEILAEVLAASPNKDRFLVVKILMSYQLRYAQPVKQNWRDYVIHADGNYYCDIFGLDAYSEDWTPAAIANNGYEPAALSHAPAWEVKAATGLPVAITECGAKRQTTDTNGARQLQWFKDSLAISEANGALWWGPWADNHPSWWPYANNTATDPVGQWLKPRIVADHGKASQMVDTF